MKKIKLEIGIALDDRKIQNKKKKNEKIIKSMEKKRSDALEMAQKEDEKTKKKTEIRGHGVMAS